MKSKILNLQGKSTAQTKLDYSITRLKEFALCGKYQDGMTSIDDSNIILEIICDEIEEMFKDGELK